MRFSRCIPAVFMVALLLACTVYVPDTGAEGDSTTTVYAGDFLLDRGNGDTVWMKITEGATYADTIIATLTASDVDCSYSAGVFTIEGKSSTTIGGADTGGSFTVSGTTGHITTSTWRTYRWDTATSEWAETPADTAYSGGPLAVAFYPSGILPVETPIEKSSWTMIYADAENSGNQVAEFSIEASTYWSIEGNETAYGCYSGALYARGHAFLKFGSSQKGTNNGSMVCLDARTGTVEWTFDYPVKMIEMSCAVIAGQYLFVQSSSGLIYRMEWAVGPGVDNSNVTTFGNQPYGAAVDKIPYETGAVLVGEPPYGEGPYSMLYDSGSIFVKCRNGMIYCFDMDLNLQWSYQMEGGSYVAAPTVMDGFIASGAYDGCIYINDKTDGSLIVKETVYFEEGHGVVNTPVFLRVPGGYKMFVTYSDGLVMDSKLSGLMVYDFDGTTFTLVRDLGKKMGSVTSYLSLYESDTFSGVLVSAQLGLYKVNGEGKYTQITNVLSGATSPHSAPTVLNGKYIYASTWGKYKLYCLDIEGNILGEFDEPIKNYSMACPALADNMVFHCNDVGVTCVTSTFPEYVDPLSAPEPTPLWVKLLVVLGVIIGVLVVLWLILRFALKWEHPFADLKKHIYTYFYGENYTHNTKSKRKLHAVIILGLILLIGSSLLSLCVGSKTVMGIDEAVSGLISSLQKRGSNLTANEYLIYVDRMPRIIAAIGAGIGLSVAGAMYQAVIKNPLVEPYIMGVSSGAGTLAIGVIAFEFTFFGLFPLNSPYLTAICAIIGGLFAFFVTMFLAIKTGGKSINYVLAGVVIGLVFSAIQSLMIIQAGHKITNAISWLYGSFTGITWEEAWIVLIPALAISLVPLIWSREFNLILLGDDQAKQMGLNAERFDRIMLILASVLTAFCVAFCGIIGFVGLVIPHVSRMILGGDHRLMLPVTIVLGGTLMVMADLLARILVVGYELPVGAVTTMIGVPMFAYLLIKRRGYDA